MAANCWVPPAAIDAVVGVTVTDTSTGAVTVTTADPLTPLNDAPMLEVPVAAALASPLVEIGTAEGREELHVTDEVRSCALPSLYDAVAINCWALPAGSEIFPGDTAIETSTGGVTTSPVDPVIPVSVALMTELPAATALARPKAETEATLVWLELHAT